MEVERFCVMDTEFLPFITVHSERVIFGAVNPPLLMQSVLNRIQWIVNIYFIV